MRITNQIIVQRQLDSLQANVDAIDKAQTAVSSGKRLQAASDDPTAASQIMTSASALRAITQYRTNVSAATGRVNSEDSVLQQLTDLMTRAQQIAVQQGSANSSASTRAAAAAEAGGLLQSAAQLGNTKFGDEYLFGGDASTTPPFTVAGSGSSTTYTSNNPSGQRSIQIGDGQTMMVTHDGTQVFVNTGALAALHQLTTALAAGDVSGINAASTSLNAAFDTVQGVLGDVGARGNQLSMASAQLDSYEGTVKTLKSSLEDIDAATAITELTSRQTAYQAALLGISKSTGLSLTDYLK